MDIFTLLEEAEQQTKDTEKLLARLQLQQQSFSDEISGRMKQLLKKHQHNKEQIISRIVDITTILTQLAISVENQHPGYFGEYFLTLKSFTPVHAYKARRFSVGENKFHVTSSNEKLTFDTVDTFVRLSATDFDFVKFCEEILKRIKYLGDSQVKNTHLLKNDMEVCIHAFNELMEN